VMSLWMYAGAGQFIALGLFAAGVSLWQVCLIQLVVNIRHTAYGLSMLKRFRGLGMFKPYLIFSLTDETFALLSSMQETQEAQEPSGSGETQQHKRCLFMVYVATLNHAYWVAGSVAGALAGTLIPIDMQGVSFALTALFVVLMIEQIKRVKKPGVFIVSAFAALAGVFLLTRTLSILVSLCMALLFSFILANINSTNTSSKGREHEQH